MALETLTEPLDAAAIGRLGEERDEPGWLRDLRRSWWERAEAAGWPTGQEEEWRRTSLAELPRTGALLTVPPPTAYQVDEAATAAGVVATDLDRAVTERLERLRRRRNRKALAQKLLKIGDQCSRLPAIDIRAPDEMLYDERGLPQ